MCANPKQLLLVRHGQTDWNLNHIPQGHIDVPLNHKGRKQAQALGERLRGWEIDAIHTSDLSRAAETAAILGAATGPRPLASAAWREFDLGGWAGLDDLEVTARFGDELEAIARGEDVARGGGETMAAVMDRVRQGYERLRAKHTGDRVVVVSHGGALKALIGYLIGLEMHQLSRLSTRGNTGLSIIDFDSGFARLVLLNDTSHIDR
jgi:broad specificity phosphatase PhoE